MSTWQTWNSSIINKKRTIVLLQSHFRHNWICGAGVCTCCVVFFELWVKSPWLFRMSYLSFNLLPLLLRALFSLFLFFKRARMFKLEQFPTNLPLLLVEVRIAGYSERFWKETRTRIPLVAGAEQSVRLLGSRYLAAGREREKEKEWERERERERTDGEQTRSVDSVEGRRGLEYWLPKLGNTEETSCVV